MFNYNQQIQEHRPKEGLSIKEYIVIYGFKDIDKILIGRNKIFEILRELEILDSNNIPQQTYRKYFNVGVNKYERANGYFRKPQVFVNAEGEVYLASRINNYILDNGYSESKGKTIKKDESFNRNNQDELSKTVGPLEFEKDEALTWCKSLPEFIRPNSLIFKQLLNKWGFTEQELNG